MELPHIGKHCHFSSCNQLDFLPFVCDSCKETFCLTHKSREDHQCPIEVESQSHELRSENPCQGDKSYPCSIEGCLKRELAQISCHHCDGYFCLNHRLQEDHNCPKLPEKKPEVSKTAQHVQEILANRQYKAKVTPTNPKAIQMAAKVNLMKMKTKAEGDSGIPQSERVYFKVIPPIDSGKHFAPLFFSKMWSVGRIIDVIADRLSLSNTNNIPSEKKLRLFHGDTGILLQTEKSIWDIMSMEDNLLLTGGCVILERVSDDEDVLEGLQRYSR